MHRILLPLAISLFAACSAPTSTTPTVAPIVTAEDPFTTRLNVLRRERGLGPVGPNVLLSKAAQAHADDMVRRGYFAHRTPEGTRADRRIAATGYRDCGWAENIGEKLANEMSALEAWRNSPGHYVNLVERKYTEYGLGNAGGKWVMLLAKAC